MARKITEDSNKKRFVARVLGSQPTVPQEIYFWCMVLSTLCWPVVLFVTIFFFDAPIRSTIDDICRWGMVLTIWLYPIYLIPLIGLWFRLSKRLRATWLYYFFPLVPVALLFLFGAIGSSEFAERKPEGYDSSTFERLDDTFAKDINHVYYNNRILEEADPTSFRILKGNYSADNSHVWYYDRNVEGANPRTFVTPDNNNSLDVSYSIVLAHDDHDYYCGVHPLHVADMASFKQKGSSWAIDSLHVYYLGVGQIGKSKVPIGDYHTFRALNNSYAADDKCVYFQNKVVEGADPESFVALKEGYHYGQDKNCIYYQARATSIKDLNALKHKDIEYGLGNAFHSDGTTVYNPELMPMPDGTDFATIHRVEPYRDWYADKRRVYYKNRLLPEANPQTFKILPLHYVSKDYASNNNKDDNYSCDGNHVYYRDSLMSRVDIASFICGYDLEESQSFAFDKNRYYQGNPNPRLEELRQGKCRVVSE